MALKKNEKKLLIVLGAVAAVFLFDKFVLGSKSDKPVPPPAKAGTARIPAVGQPAVSTKEETVKVMYPNWGKNPFSGSYYIIDEDTKKDPSTAHLSTSKTEEEKKGPELKGIFVKGGKSYALINEHVFSEGDEIEGIRVERIFGMEVLCHQGNKSFTLEWRESP